MSKVTLTIKKTAWVFAAAFVAVMSFVHVDAEAHVQSGAKSYWCSPHNAAGSVSGTAFLACSSTDLVTFHRDIFCDFGTDCANALCGAGQQLCTGHSSSSGFVKGSFNAHGKNGGHKANVDLGSLYCQSGYCP